jgi:hypothetical protein
MYIFRVPDVIQRMWPKGLPLPTIQIIGDPKHGAVLIGPEFKR